MSSFQFLASDDLLMEVSNPYVELLSINEAIERDIELDDFFLQKTKEDRNEKIILRCDSEEHLNELQITYDRYYSSTAADEYSQKQYFAQINWYYTEARAKQLMDYILEQLEVVNKIEIWSVWLDDDQPARSRTINGKELTITDLTFLDLKEGFQGPECLVVVK